MFIKDDAKVPELICNHPKKIQVNGAMIGRMRRSIVGMIATRLWRGLAPVDNFESGLFPPDLLLPTHPRRTFDPRSTIAG